MLTQESGSKQVIYEWIARHVPEGGRVMDIGCGEGDLLAFLAKDKQVRGTGIELDEDCVLKAIQQGLSVHHGDIEEGLDHYSDDSFDVAVLSLTIQELGDMRGAIREAFRVGKQVVVVFPNFGHWQSRWQLLCGHAPKTRVLPYTWDESPNRHFFTVTDWECLCKKEGWRIEAKGFLSGHKRVACMANLRADVAMYLMAGREGRTDKE